MTDLAVLNSELTVDPTGAGYSGMTDEQAAAELNIVNKNRNRVTMSGKEVKDNIDTVDWDSRSVDQQQILLALFARNDLDPFGIDQHIFQEAMTGAVGTSLADLTAARVETVSRATILGLPVISVGDVKYARQL